jgi:cysteine desulfurase family protein
MSIYLDNGATSFPKPLKVQQAITSALTDYKGSMGRSNATEIHTLERLVYDTRLLIAKQFNFSNPDHVVFTKNITESLNLFLFGFLKQGDHVLMSALEHNAVARPLEALKVIRQIKVTLIPCDAYGQLDLIALEGALKEKPALVIINHASNVSGDIQDLGKIGRLTHQYETPLLVDAAQTAGVVPIDMKAMFIDVLTVTGHKALYGPQGIGGILMTPEIAFRVTPLLYGGTGSLSEQLTQPSIMPDKFESGTPNSLGILGLKAGIEFIQDYGIEAIHKKETDLIEKLQRFVESIPDIQIVGNPDVRKRVGILAVTFTHKDNAIIAHDLAKNYDIVTRVGMQCAPLAHQSYGTFPHGTIRFSTSVFTTDEEIERTIHALKMIIEA